ncbi:MAG: pyridoxamine 5'-phosphate oxidase family protein [Acidimicrobiia bacterium]|nr:pyridoxamine 5'-phosphate oxidase family protein [Acidimicrobiia bacterium]
MPSPPLTVRALDRVLVALDAPVPALPDGDGSRPGDGATVPSAERTVLAAEVLASWFGASLQFVTTDTASTEQLDRLSGTIGLRTEPVLVLAGSAFGDDLHRHAVTHAPCLVVAAADDQSLAVARAGAQPTYLVPHGPKRRQPSGPLLVVLEAGDELDDALALATVWSQSLDLGLRLVPGDHEGAVGEAERARVRLEAMGVPAAVEAPGWAVEEAFDSADAPLALVVAAHRLTGTGNDDLSDTVARVLAAGGSVLVAPAATSLPAREPLMDLNALHDLSAALGTTSDDADSLSASECTEVLRSSAVGRLAYVDHGWPVVVPINFSLHEGDIFIRSVQGGKLEAAVRNERVCFEVDRISSAERQGRSVIVHGHLEVIRDPGTLQAAWAHDPAPWVDDNQMLWLRLVALATTGRTVG